MRLTVHSGAGADNAGNRQHPAMIGQALIGIWTDVRVAFGQLAALGCVGLKRRRS